MIHGSHSRVSLDWSAVALVAVQWRALIKNVGGTWAGLA